MKTYLSPGPRTIRVVRHDGNSNNWKVRTMDGLPRFLKGDNLALALVVITAVGILMLAVVVLMGSWVGA